MKHKWKKRDWKATAPTAQLLLHVPNGHKTLNVSHHISWIGRGWNKAGLRVFFEAEETVVLCWSFWQSHINTRQPCDRVNSALKALLLGNLTIFHKGVFGFTWNVPLNFSPTSNLIREIFLQFTQTNQNTLLPQMHDVSNFYPNPYVITLLFKLTSWVQKAT